MHKQSLVLFLLQVTLRMSQPHTITYSWHVRERCSWLQLSCWLIRSFDALPGDAKDDCVQLYVAIAATWLSCSAWGQTIGAYISHPYIYYLFLFMYMYDITFWFHDCHGYGTQYFCINCCSLFCFLFSADSTIV